MAGVSTAYARHPHFAHVVHRRHPKRADCPDGVSLTLEPVAFCNRHRGVEKRTIRTIRSGCGTGRAAPARLGWCHPFAASRPATRSVGSDQRNPCESLYLLVCGCRLRRCSKAVWNLESRRRGAILRIPGFLGQSVHTGRSCRVASRDDHEQQRDIYMLAVGGGQSIVPVVHGDAAHAARRSHCSLHCSVTVAWASGGAYRDADRQSNLQSKGRPAQRPPRRHRSPWKPRCGRSGSPFTEVTDADYRSMDAAIKRHAATVRREGPGTISLFYYSGHGAADADTKTNYLIPVDVAEADDADLWNVSLNLTNIVERIRAHTGGHTLCDLRCLPK
jgi:hypothetical protein